MKKGVLMALTSMLLLLICCVPKQAQLEGTWEFIGYTDGRVESVFNIDNTICFDTNGNGVYYPSSDSNVKQYFSYVLSGDHKITIMKDGKISNVEYSINQKSDRLTLDGFDYRYMSSDTKMEKELLDVKLKEKESITTTPTNIATSSMITSIPAQNTSVEESVIATAETTVAPGQTSVETPEPTSSLKNNIPKLKKNGKEIYNAASLSLYDTVTFGSYMQSQYGLSSPIEWIVIGFDGTDRVRLLSKYALDSLPYHDTNSMVTWSASSLYRWLNNTFLVTAFSSDEQKLIVGPITVPSDQQANGIPLTYRNTISTEYAIANGSDKMRCIWWLSDPTGLVKWGDSMAGYCASVVNETGEIVQKASQVNYIKAVRPMMLLQLQGLS